MTLAVQRLSRFAAAFAVLLLTMSGCVNIDRDYPRDPTTTFPPVPDTRLARDVEPLLTDRPPDQSGFHILSDGIDALTVRLLLAARVWRHAV
ncbi:MAG: hypothetical protein KJN90_04805 [Gammaproteobacteria bacterium]|nr:hypothetical protein [Gammaproteobacteria bacterium]